MQEENNHILFTAEDIRRYHEGKLSSAQMHAMEKASLEDPFLADALEGYAVEEVKVPADLDELKARLKERLDDKDNKKVMPMAAPVKPFNWLRIAAMIVAIGGAGLLVYNIGFNTSRNENSIAQETAKKDNPQQQQTIVPATDSIQSQQTPEAAATTKAPAKVNTEAVANSTQNNGLIDQRLAEKSGLDKQYKAEQDRAAAAELQHNTATLSMKKAAAPSGQVIAPDVNEPKQLDTMLAGRLPGIAVQKEEKSKDLAIRGYSTNDKNVAAGNGYLNQNRNASNYEINNNNQQASRARRQLAMQPSVNVFRGKVTDYQNNPLPFANITNLSDDIGTYADAQGNFVLTSPDSIMNVQVRSLGFENNLTQLQNGLTVNKVELKDDNSIPAIVLSNKKANARQKQGSMVLEEPEPADGWTKYDAYLANNLKLPDAYRTKPQESGEVELSFEVNSIGEPINIKVEKSLCEVCDKEAIRLLKEGPKWKRKAKKGKRTTITIPF